ncbi:hypothetical protein ACJW30_05G058900 [Castanea mollissima]
MNYIDLSRYEVGKIEPKHHILSLRGISSKMWNAIKTDKCSFYLRSKKPKNSNRVQFSNILDTIANNETHIARFEYLYELTNKIYCGPIHCRIKSKPRINIRSMKDQTQMHFFGKLDSCKMGQIVRDADKKRRVLFNF